MPQMKLLLLNAAWFVAFAIMCRAVLCSASNAKVKWTPNENVKVEHKDAHYAPRSQKYWDEHNIERPDYAKTDAEIMAERGERIGLSKLLAFAWILCAIVFLTILGFATNIWNWLLEVFGIRGHRLGRAQAGNKRVSEKEARLQRFENPTFMLDNLKAD
jgi:Flp pilus assembly protein TadB